MNIDGSIWIEVDFVVLACFELKEHLFLAYFSEVELALIEGLQNFINTKLCWPLLQMPSLIQLRNESIFPRNHLYICIIVNEMEY